MCVLPSGVRYRSYSNIAIISTTVETGTQGNGNVPKFGNAVFPISGTFLILERTRTDILHLQLLVCHVNAGETTQNAIDSVNELHRKKDNMINLEIFSCRSLLKKHIQSHHPLENHMMQQITQSGKNGRSGNG
jgi:hypothetical protein